MTAPVLVVGAGWSGAVVARELHDAGVPVEVLERGKVVGGHSRVETLCGVTYEPNGPHIFHTEHPRVVRYVRRFGVTRPFAFRPLTEIELADGTKRLMSWPIQVEELEALPDWPRIERELSEVAETGGSIRRGNDFESYAVNMMGRRLYQLFIEGYTRKQWGREPRELSSSFAPKRIDLRRDGVRGLFRNCWQMFPREGVNDAIEQVLAPVRVTCGADVYVDDLANVEASAIVVTAALDDFAGRQAVLDWRGVHLRSRYFPTAVDEKRMPAYVINRPSMSVPYTRTIETKHATGQQVHGTVVSEEYPGADARHYPVATTDGRNERMNESLQASIVEVLAPVPVFFCGRLATYRYINQDEAIMDAFDCAEKVLRACG